MKKDNRKSVFEVYNKVADWFAENRDKGLIERSYLDQVITLIKRNARILDLGCGTGQPILDYLTKQGLDVTGVDASQKILSLARENFPSTTFIQADMRQLSLGKKFHAVIAWHSFFHLPVEDQPAMFKIFSNHLLSNGILLFTSGTEHGEAWGLLGGENLFHGSLSTKEYKKLLTAHDFSLLKHQIDDPDCGNATVWIAKYTPQSKYV
ncbi:dTDP-3-amino-3,4,6-trideoxy-alpha-D-glucopyranose [compost metagenome]